MRLLSSIRIFLGNVFLVLLRNIVPIFLLNVICLASFCALGSIKPLVIASYILNVINAYLVGALLHVLQIRGNFVDADLGPWQEEDFEDEDGQDEWYEDVYGEDGVDFFVG
jgi:hypothetical protein